MEILLNELSLTDQFDSIEHFIDSGLNKIFLVFRELQSDDILLKKQEFYSCKVYGKKTIYEVLTSKIAITYDEIRRFKIYLNRLFEDPYWENDLKHDLYLNYLYDNKNITGTSLAEACERDQLVISFNHSDFNSATLKIFKENNEIILNNLVEKGNYINYCYEKKIISFEEYCIYKFKDSKLDFSEIYIDKGFNLIPPNEEELFLDSLRKFSELTWQQIFVDDGLDYKEFNNNQYFKDIPYKIYKFRISSKYRIFGYVKKGGFFVLLFDLEHFLSNQG